MALVPSFRFWLELSVRPVTGRDDDCSLHVSGTFSTTTRSEPLYPKKLEGSVVMCGIRGLTTDTRPTSIELSNPKL